ncbi:transposase [Clostridium sp. BJN0013]|uniref:transposase n=1 Tax=Clostridium sp. BJN0013 TaxID=3236840 RepID=UPI0034C5E892
MGKRREFSVEYKKEIIKLITEQGRKVTHVAREIGVSESAVRKWVKEYGTHGDNAFPGKGKLRSEDEKLRLLKKKMADLEEENAILKKAIRIFTKPEK